MHDSITYWCSIKPYWHTNIVSMGAANGTSLYLQTSWVSRCSKGAYGGQQPQPPFPLNGESSLGLASVARFFPQQYTHLDIVVKYCTSIWLVLMFLWDLVGKPSSGLASFRHRGSWSEHLRNFNNNNPTKCLTVTYLYQYFQSLWCLVYSGMEYLKI